MDRLITAALLLLAAPAFAQDVLLIPNSGTDSIMTVDPATGAVLNSSFITDATRFQLAFHAVPSGQGTILVSDQNADSVFEYGLNGAYVRTVASSAQGLDNIRGIAVRSGKLFVTVGGGTLTNTVQSFNLDGSGQATFINTNLSSPFAVKFRANDVLVSNSSSHLIQRYDLNGNFLSTFHSGLVRFPQQMFEEANGELSVAGFSTPAGAYRYDAAGTQVDYDNVTLSLRGVHRLSNGLLLYTGGTRLGTVDTTTGADTTILNQAGSSFRYIEFADITVIPEPFGLTLLAGAGVALWLRRRSIHAPTA